MHLPFARLEGHMSENRLKIKIGDHEFEAEGPAEVVQAQFAAFTELVGRLPARTEKPPQAQPKPETQPEEEIKEQGNGSNGSNSGALNLEKIMRVEGRYVSLTVRANSVPEAVLLLLLGQRHYRGNDSVTGAELLSGLRETGMNVGRVDYTMDRLSNEGFVITLGVGRGRRYRLNNAGIMRAQEIARALIATVP
jgi:DNA-binding transcriptional ArsR family regulator